MVTIANESRALNGVPERASRSGYARRSSIDGSPLIGQFVLGKDENQVPSGWLVESIGSWSLGRHPNLPVMRLIGVDDRAVGWMLGYPISEAGRLLADGEVLTLPAQTLESSDALEAFVYSFGGRFSVVWLDGSGGRFYLDPCGSLAAVYCADQHLLASTPSLVPADEHTGRRVELAQAIGFPRRQGSYPLGLTPRYGVERLLPNHYLDLSDWRAVRHWPKQPLSESTGVEDAVAEIAAIVKRQIRAVVTTMPTYLFLTAGKDSRTLLACARDLADRLELVTTAHDDEIAEIDCRTAAAIAKRFGLSHRVLPMDEGTQDDLNEWVYRTGCSVGEVRGWQGATTYKRLPNGHAGLLGTIGELGRGYWWQTDDTETTVLTPERLVALCKCPPHAEPLARARAWLDSVPTTNALDVLALFLLEQDCGCWAGAWAYADCDFGYDVFPLSHRRIVERMLTLPVSYRRSGNLQRDVITREWPELLAWPFNEEAGLRRILRRAKRATRRRVAPILQGALGIVSRIRGAVQAPVVE